MSWKGPTRIKSQVQDTEASLSQIQNAGIRKIETCAKTWYFFPCSPFLELFSQDNSHGKQVGMLQFKESYSELESTRTKIQDIEASILQVQNAGSRKI